MVQKVEEIAITFRGCLQSFSCDDGIHMQDTVLMLMQDKSEGSALNCCIHVDSLLNISG